MSLAIALVLAACSPSDGGSDTTATDEPTTTITETTTTVAETTTTEAMDHGEMDLGGEPNAEDVIAATLATAAFQDPEAAEAAGYASTMDALGCFESAESGGMGLHYLNGSLMDGTLDVTTPEALVYEMDAAGNIVGLVGHEYIVPVEAWTDPNPPSVFGQELHEHPVLPLWVLHAWLWKDNPAGFFNDWNPKVRMCPDDVPLFGVDLP